jgi:hypothetical protein
MGVGSEGINSLLVVAISSRFDNKYKIFSAET